MDEPRPQGPESLGGGGFIGREGQPLLSLKILADHGAMGRIYSAEYPNGQKAVVKQLKPDRYQSGPALSHFKNEAAILRRLQQAGVPGVPRLHNVVIDEADLANTYLVMDFVEGVSDGFEIRERYKDPLEVERAALRITKAIAEIITAAYKAGVDYFDVKSYFGDNMFVNLESYTVTIVDWGAAKLGEPKNDSNASVIPRISNILGTLLNINHADAYNKEGKLTAPASKALAALSPGTRSILARAFYTSQGRGYRSGDELIHDLDKALQHISDPFVPASIEEINRVFPQKEKTPEQQFKEKCSERIAEMQDDPAIPEILRPTVRNLVGRFYELLGAPPKSWSVDLSDSIKAVADPAALPEHIRTGVYEPIQFMLEFRKRLRAEPDSPRREQQLEALGLPQSSAIAEYLLFGENAPQESLRRIKEFFRENMAAIRELGLTVPQVLKQFVPAEKPTLTDEQAPEATRQAIDFFLGAGPFFEHVAQTLYNLVSSPDWAIHAPVLSTDRGYRIFLIMSKDPFAWSSEMRSRIALVRLLAQLYIQVERSRSIQVIGPLHDNRQFFLSGIRSAMEYGFLGDKAPNGTGRKAQNFLRYLKTTQDLGLRKLLDENPLPDF